MSIHGIWNDIQSVFRARCKFQSASIWNECGWLMFIVKPHVSLLYPELIMRMLPCDFGEILRGNVVFLYDSCQNSLVLVIYLFLLCNDWTDQENIILIFFFQQSFRTEADWYLHFAQGNVLCHFMNQVCSRNVLNFPWHLHRTISPSCVSAEHPHILR